MSLDVYLRMKGAQSPGEGPQIFIRENGRNVSISREEWDRRFPDREPVTMEVISHDTVYEANITHNLWAMADAAGIYKELWRPEEIDITTAKQLIEPLQKGLALLKSDPTRFEALNPENGWGDYPGLVSFVEDYLEACVRYPDAEVGASR